MATPVLFSCQFSSAFGGVPQTLFDIVKYLDKSRFEPIVLCPRQGPLPLDLAAEGIRTRTVGTGQYWRYTPTQPLGTFSDLWVVAREIARIARSENLRLVHTFDGMVFFAACLAKLYFKDLKVLWLDCGWNIYRYHFRLVMRWCFRHAVRVLAPTRRRMKQLLAEGLDHRKSGVLPCGTDFHIRPRTHAFPEPPANGRVRVGIIGRIVPIKRFEMFLQAARIVADTNPQVEFSIVGSQGLFKHEVKYYHRIRGLTNSLNLTDRVTFHDPPENLLPLLSTFDLLVSSSYLETFGRTLIEAMALSKPVVATAVGGIPEVVTDGETGFLVPSGDVATMAERISRLVEDAGLREVMGQRGKDRVLRYFDIRCVTRKWEALYTELLQGSAGPNESPKDGAVEDRDDSERPHTPPRFKQPDR
ncbi:MAG: glycosyltransferase family 4 protein [Acidobacteria bacterium]|nr:glycosyltransferase family 4 protein [Acidobacteriota bacterium]MCI0719220.1 glycosyltransferase family 4 protein [Acidobacteriota bacterium]